MKYGWKPNWRNVWIGSAAGAAALSGLLTIAIFEGEAAPWQDYAEIWAIMWVALTVHAVVFVYRVCDDEAKPDGRQLLAYFDRATERMYQLVTGSGSKG